MWNPETNIKGPKGDKGDTGDQGIPGTPGADGASDWADITGKPSTFPPDPEAVDDRVAALLVAGSNITLTYNDTGNTLTIASTASGGGGSSVYVGPTPPVGAAASSLWFENDTGLLYINYNDGNSTQWVIVPPSVSAASIGAVAYTVQSPAASEQTQARKNIYAAPFDALAYNGMQVNGSMEVSQELGTGNAALPAATIKYIADGFIGVNLGATRVGFGAQTPITSLSGFPSCISLIASTPAALAANDAQYIYQSIEGYRWSRLGFSRASEAQPVTIAFWLNANVAGTMAVSVRNAAGNRSYIVDVPYVGGGVWQYKTVTIPGCPDGTWNTGNAVGANISFCFGAGTSYHGAANTWLTTNSFATSATTNLWAAANGIYLTGVVILPGIEAPSAARSPLIMRPYDQELLTCMRYLQTPAGSAQYGFAAYTPAATLARVGLPFRVLMRSTPTLLIKNIASININTPSVNVTPVSLTLQAASIGMAAIDATISASTFTLGQGCTVAMPDPSIMFDARL